MGFRVFSARDVSAFPTFRLDPTEDPFVVLSLIDVDPGYHEHTTSRAVQGQAVAARDVEGFGAGIVLANMDLALDFTGGAVDDNRRRVVTIDRWDSQSRYLSALLDEEALRYQRDIAAKAKRLRTCTYRVADARSAGGSHSAEVSADPGLHYNVIWSVADDRAKRDMCLEYNVWETDRYISDLSGFGFALYLSGYADHDWAELTQWDTTADFISAYRDPEFQHHIPVNNRYCAKEVGLYKAVAVATA